MALATFDFLAASIEIVTRAAGVKGFQLLPRR
jgi:hypothetical protein